jgi:hypothetical protein
VTVDFTPVTNAEWNEFHTMLFPNGNTAISREGVNSLLESRDREALMRAAAADLYEALSDMVSDHASISEATLAFARRALAKAVKP